MKKSLAVFVVWPAVFIFAILSFATTKPVHAANLGETCNVNIGSAGVGASQRSGICRAITSTSGCQPGEENIAMGNCTPTAMVNGANVALRCCGPPVAPTTCVGAGGVCWPSGTCSSPVPGNPSCYPSSTEVCCQRGAIGATPSTNDSFTVTGRDLLNYQLLEQIPGSDETVGRLDTYLQDIYRFAFWTVGIAVVFMLTIGGFMYLTAAGNTSRMESAKTVIFDAILGLVLTLVAWLFLYVINPDLVNLNLRAISITPIASRTAPTAPAPTPSTPGVPPPSGTVPACNSIPGVNCNPCANCSAIPTSIPYKPCGLGSCYLNSALLGKIMNISGVSGWRITESWPPTVYHSSSCHTNGTCADINNSGGPTDPATIKRYYDAFTAAGLNVLYENGGNCTPYRALGIRCSSPRTMTNGSSFHVL